jgi:integrase
MSSLFKPTKPVLLPPDSDLVIKNDRPHVRIRIDGKTVLCKVTKAATHFLKPADKWYGKYRDADGKLQKPPLSPNKEAARTLLNNLLDVVEKEKATGRKDPTLKHQKKPLTEHLNDWDASLRAKNVQPDGIAQKLSRVRAVVKACEWVYAADMNADKLETFLAELRDNRPELPAMPAGEEFSSKELAYLLGVKQCSIPKQVQRYRLPATGNGKKRRFPRETVETLRSMKLKGRAIGTTNDWLQAVRQFARWMVPDRIATDPFVKLKALNAEADTRRRRGELSTEELTALITNTSASSYVFRGLDGSSRAMLYRVAVGTGYRTAELAALTPDSFDLDDTTPAANLSAEFTKNGKAASQPLSAVLVADLRRFLVHRDRKTPVWPSLWSKRSADMLRQDLAAAAIPVEVDGPEGIETRDFHALRACYISSVIRAGADLKQAMTLARHSDPKLTTKRYARTRLHDLSTVVDAMPDLDFPATQKNVTNCRSANDGNRFRLYSGCTQGCTCYPFRDGTRRVEP